jgi:hypothetical protein
MDRQTMTNPVIIIIARYGMRMFLFGLTRPSKKARSVELLR